MFDPTALKMAFGEEIPVVLTWNGMIIGEMHLTEIDSQRPVDSPDTEYTAKLIAVVPKTKEQRADDLAKMRG
jgi:hypothetical protein